MAKIPDAYSVYGERPGPEVMPAVRPSRAGAMVADGLADVAQSVNRAAAVERQKVNKFAYASARSALLQADIEARRTLENDQDWATYEKRYTEAMGKAREKALGLIADKGDKAEFDLQSNLDLQRGAAEIRGIARGKEIDWGRSTLEDQLAKNREAALNAKDEKSRAAIVAASNEIIDGAIEQGYVKREEAGTVRRNFTAAYGEGVIEMLPPDQQVAMLSNPQGTPADFIDPAKRAGLLERAKREVKMEERAAAQEQRSRIQQARSDAEWSQRQNADEAWKLRAAGISVAEIQRKHPAVWRGLDGHVQMSILNDEKNQADGGQTATDWNLYYSLVGKSRTDKGRAELEATLPGYFDRLAPTERRDLMSRIEVRPTATDDLDALTFDKQIEVATPNWKADKRGPFQQAVGAAVQAEQVRVGRKLNQTERQTIIDNYLIEGDVRTGGLMNANKQLYEIAGTKEELQFVPDDIAEQYDTIPEDEKRAIKNELIRAGGRATPMNVYTLWLAGQAK